jgi:hypothetical protein
VFSTEICFVVKLNFLFNVSNSFHVLVQKLPKKLERDPRIFNDQVCLDPKSFRTHSARGAKIRGVWALRRILARCEVGPVGLSGMRTWFSPLVVEQINSCHMPFFLL